MELTTQQIQRVEQYLNAKGIDYIDIRLEVLDHIVTDIEVLMDKKTIDFETAFYKVTDKWNVHLKETSSFYFGIMYSESKIVIKKAVKMFKSYFFLYMSAYFFPFILLRIFPVYLNGSFASFVDGFSITVSSIALIYMIILIIKTFKSKLNTTYRFILKTQFWGIILLIIGILTESYNKTGELNSLYIGMMCSGVSSVFICHHFYKKHKEAIKKYNIS